MYLDNEQESHNFEFMRKWNNCPNNLDVQMIFNRIPKSYEIGVFVSKKTVISQGSIVLIVVVNDKRDKYIELCSITALFGVLLWQIDIKIL